MAYSEKTPRWRPYFEWSINVKSCLQYPELIYTLHKIHSACTKANEMSFLKANPNQDTLYVDRGTRAYPWRYVPWFRCVSWWGKSTVLTILKSVVNSQILESKKKTWERQWYSLQARPWPTTRHWWLCSVVSSTSEFDRTRLDLFQSMFFYSLTNDRYSYLYLLFKMLKNK